MICICIEFRHQLRLLPTKSRIFLPQHAPLRNASLPQTLSLEKKVYATHIMDALWLYYSLICFTRSSWAVHLSNPPSYSLMQYSVGGFAVSTYLGLVLRYNWIGMLSIQCYWEAIKNSHSISEMRHCFATLLAQPVLYQQAKARKYYYRKIPRVNEQNMTQE